MMTNQLSDLHYQVLSTESAISDEVINRRGAFTVDAAAARGLGFSLVQTSTMTNGYGGMAIPYFRPDGSAGPVVLRLDVPRSLDDKRKKKLPDGTYPQRVVKYDMVKGSGNVLDCHPDIWPILKDPTSPLYFTEGAKKADSLISQGFPAINLNGVWGWRGTNSSQGKAALSDFDDIALNGRVCYLVFDSDIRHNKHIKQAVRRFRAYLLGKDAIVYPILLPGKGEDKAGIDDYFASGKTADDFRMLIDYWSMFEADIGGRSSKEWSTEKIKTWHLERRFVFAINDMSETMNINGKPMTDTHQAIIRTMLRDDGIPIEHSQDTQVLMGDEKRYHPIKDYFSGLEWDGKIDHIGLLATYFEDEQGVFADWLRKWLIGAVAKVLGDGANQNFMLVMDGGQGLGKSEFSSWICPLKDLFIEEPINPEDKDSRIRLMSNFVWEAGELGHVVRKQDREAFKQFISTKTVQVRPPYGRHDITKSAVVSFIGTVNNEGGGFLNDPTGNRRYAVATITSIDWKYSEDLDVDSIWGQAVALYHGGENWNIQGDEARRRDEINEEYMAADPLEDMVRLRFEIDPTKAKEDGWQLATAQILAILGEKTSDKGAAMRLSVILNKSGLKKGKGYDKITKARPRVWKGIRKLEQSDIFEAKSYEFDEDNSFDDFVPTS